MIEAMQAQSFKASNFAMENLVILKNEILTQE